MKLENISLHLLNMDYLTNHSNWRNESIAWLRSTTKTNALYQKEFFSGVPYGQEWFAIEENGELIGTCGLTNISTHHKTAEFSLLISPNYRKKGLGTLALLHLLRFAFDELKLDLIYGETYLYPPEAKEFLLKMKQDFIETPQGLLNPGAKAYQKLGFSQDAILRKRFKKFGFSVDSVIYSILPGEIK